ncbi:MAG: 3-oxoacyl-[acyl-carrier-protein] reductase [Pseudomonadota bacterium]|jgi:NAD(P)-dependent dehydrogenase (short-subunit alcohol dehydrogenase family)
MSSPLALVTGGGSGIGRCLVETFARNGYAVAFSDRSSGEGVTALTGELGGDGCRVLAINGDVGVREDVEAFVDAAVDWHGEAPSVLVNNAGTQTWSPLLDLTEVRWNEVIRTNLTGCFLNTQAVARRMKLAGRGGAIINIGSGCNKLAFPNLVDYTASKGGIEQFTKSAAVELGPLGITVNCVAPGAIATERTAREAPDYTAAWSPITPLRRVGTPADVADVVLFFASPAARFVTGQTLWVDGGLFTQPAWPYS